MKKTAGFMKTVIMICISLLCLSACGTADENESIKEQKKYEAEEKDMSKEKQEEDKILVAYMEGLEQLAVLLREKTGGDEFIIRDETTYPQALEEYDIIYLGYIVSEDSIPDSIRLFLEGQDFAGKTVIPFCIHNGDGAGTSIYDIRNLCTDTKVTDGFSISRSELPDAKEKITFWIQTLDMR